MKPIKLYVTQYCGYCKAAKQLLNSLKLDFEEIPLDNNDNLRQQLSEQYQWRTVPMIFIGDQFIGGYQELAKLHQKHRLMDLLQEN